MRLELAYISTRRGRLKSGSTQSLAEDYIARAGRLGTVTMQAFRSEEELLACVARRTGRLPPHLILLDSRGRSLTSEGFAAALGELRDTGTQELLLAVGPADGWSAAARSQANLLLSLGAMTLPHELAFAVLAEQIYRALTILAGHPYHTGHSRDI